MVEKYYNSFFTIEDGVIMSKKKETSLSAAEVLVKCLENEGVQYIFGIPGEENLDVMNALKFSTIKFITVRHEQGAAFMADMEKGLHTQ